ncbi:MAG: hypothetical protein M5T61_03210 [Acidimicrobiia bacterium]|nr:hypothetical protein [Acidimicrobiia bacterium]
MRVIADFRPVGAGEIPPDSVVTVPGTAEIPIRLLAPGACRVRIRFLPEPLQSSRPVFSLVAAEPARAAAAVEEPAPPSGADQAASRLPRLVARLERDARLDGDVWIGLYEDVILDWMPRNTGLVEKYAAHLLAAGQFDKTTQVLDGLEDRSPDGDHMLLVASIRAGEPFDASALLPGIDLTADGPFNELLDALRKAGGEVWRQLLDPLPHKLLGDDKSHTFLLAAREHVTDEPSCIQIVEALAYVDTEAASNFAMQRWQDPGTTPSEVVDLLLQFDANRAHLLPYVEARLADLAAAGEWDDYEKTFTRAREELRDSDRRLLTSLAARHMLRSEQQGVCDRGLDLEIEASHEALALGDLDASLRAATIARAYALTRHDAEYESATKYLLDALERTIRETELFRQYEEAGQDLRAARRREWLSGKRLHIVGGQAADWQDTVRIECGLSKVTWHPAERHKAPTLDWAGGLRSADDVVVCLTDSIGHKTSGPLKDTCAKRNVPYVPADWGKRSVLDALADAAAAAADAAATSKEA